MKFTIPILTSIIVIASCHANRTAEKEIIPITHLVVRENSLNLVDSVYLINNPNEYNLYTNQINAIRRPGIHFKAIDFTQSSILILNMNMENTSYNNYEATLISSKENTLFLKGLHDEKFEGVPSQFKLIQFLEIPKTDKIDHITLKK